MMATFVGSEKCTREGCGHPESDHASGQHRPRFFCEYPDCECRDFQWAADEAMNQPNGDEMKDDSNNADQPAEEGDEQSRVTAVDLELLPYEIAESLPSLGGRFGELATLCKSHVASHIEKLIKAKQGRT